MRKKYVAGNWKMYKTISESILFAREFRDLIENEENVEIGIFANYLALESLRNELPPEINIGAENVYFENEGAFTGEVSIPMLSEIDVNTVIIGHSERREYFGETDEMINLKLKACFENNFKPILCVGESLETREKGKEKDFILNQLKNDLKDISKENVKKLVIAYEPIWAIGTGKTASEDQAEEICAFIRETISRLFEGETGKKIRIQYGGSVKPENAKNLFSKDNIDGALVGGASLKPDSFFEIIKSATSA